MARSRNKRGMGALLKEMRTSPVAAVVNGVVGIAGILGTGILIAVWAAGRAIPGPARPAASQGYVLLFLCLGALFLLGGIGFLMFALVQITTSIRVFERGLVWRRFGKKQVVQWVEVAHFGRGDTAAATLTSWNMLLHNGEKIIFHSGLYNGSEFADTMELIAEQIEETQKQLG